MTTIRPILALTSLLLSTPAWSQRILSFKLRDDVALKDWLSENPYAQNTKPLLRRDRALRAEKRARSFSGNAPLKLSLLMRFKGTQEQTMAALEFLKNDEDVEYVRVLRGSLPPPPEDFDPPTPSFVHEQGYIFEDPGINAASLWNMGITGQNIRIADIEYAWDLNHEDLVDLDVQMEEGETPHPDLYVYNYDRHGSAVLGITSSVENGYGCTGIASKIVENELKGKTEVKNREFYEKISVHMQK